MTTLTITKLYSDTAALTEAFLDEFKNDPETWANGNIDSISNINFNNTIHFSLNSNDKLVWDDANNKMTIVMDGVNEIDIAAGNFDFKTATSPTIKASGTTLLTLNATNSTLASGLTVTGDVNIQGVNVNLNSDLTEAPTETVTLKVERGTSTDAYIRYNETSDVWQLDQGDGVALSILHSSTTAAVALLNFTDTVFTFQSALTAAPTSNVRWIFNRGSSTDAEIRWDETDDVFKLDNAAGTFNRIATLQVAGKVKVLAYTGNGVDNRSITGVGFQPDTVIVSRSDGTAADVVMRSTGMTGTNSRNLSAGTVVTDDIQALEADGFQVGTAGTVNTNTVAYDAICIKNQT